MEGARTMLEHFSAITDPRIERGKRHKLIDVIIVGIVGTVCGADGWDDIEFVATEKADWLKTFLELPSGIPSADTIARVFSRISPAEFSRSFSDWMGDVAVLTDQQVVAIDGKRLRASHDNRSGKSAIHMVSAWACENGVVLGQIKVDDKSNEITAVPKLLELLNIKGCIVTLDAMGCQREIAQKILDSGADYALGLKGNQGATLEAVQQHFDTTPKDEENTHVTVDGDHGRIETREYQVAGVQGIDELSNWPGCKSIAKVTSTREVNNSKSEETRYFLLSLSPDAKKAAKAIRSHWQIENSLHWVLDVAFDEDRNRVRKDKAPENLAAVRHLAINLLKMEKTLKRSIPKKRFKCAMSNSYLGKVLAGAV